jgi:hypothetical protein
MAKGTLHLNVEFSAVADEEGKFGRLAKLLGLADSDHARGRCEHMWVACTRRGESDLPQWLVEQILGESGPDALVEAELASWSAGRGDSKTRRLRIGGAAKHCLWMSSSKDQLKQEQRAKGGESRAKTSSRQLDGTFAPHPAEHPAPSSSSEISSASTSEIFPEVPPARDPAVPTPIPTPNPALPRAPAQVGRTSVTRAELVESIAGPYSPDDPRGRGRLAEATYRRVSDALVAIAGEFKLPAPLPFPAVTPGSHPQSLRELQDRVREEGAAAPLVCDRVVANLIAQAREERSVEWLAEKAFSPKPWAAARQWTPGAAARRRGPARGDPLPPAPAPRREAPVPPLVIPADERDDVAAMARELRDRLNGTARAPPRSAAQDSPDQQPNTEAKRCQ